MAVQAVFPKTSKVFAVLLVISYMLFIGCAPQVISASDLVGEWQATYDIDSFGVPDVGTESILLRDDGKFRQRYQNPNGYIYESDWNNWWVERLPNGHYELHLEHARYFPMGILFGEEMASGKRVLFAYDPAIQKTIELKDEVILNIQSDSRSSRGISLFHFPVGDLDAPQLIKLTLLSP